MNLQRLSFSVVSIVGCCLVAQIGAAADIVPRGSEVVLVTRAEPSQTKPFTEGPACWEGHVYFSDVSSNRILRVRFGSSGTSTVKAQIFREPTGRANGLEFDAQGRLLACEGGGAGGNRRVTRTEASGSITVLAERYMGKRLNSPNDLAVDAQGRIYFTDPRYGDRSGLELDREAVYRIDPSGALTRVINDVQRPNGIAISPDQGTLYVVDNNPEKGGARKVYAYALGKDRSVGSRRLVHDFGTGRGGDGMCLDNRGSLYVSAGLNGSFSEAQDASVKAGIHIFSPKGKPLGFIPLPEDSVTNCTFGDSDLKTLYITAGTGLWRIRLNSQGVRPPAAAR